MLIPGQIREARGRRGLEARIEHTVQRVDPLEREFCSLNGESRWEDFIAFEECLRYGKR